MILEDMVTHRISGRLPRTIKLGFSYWKDQERPSSSMMMEYDARHVVETRFQQAIIAPENMKDFAISQAVRGLNRYLYGDILEDLQSLEYIISEELYLSKESEIYKHISRIKDKLKIVEE